MTAPQLRVPELVPGVELRALPLSALEGFVLSRIDGRVTIAEIVALTGLGLEQVVQILDKLVGLGAVNWKGEPPARPGSARPAASSASLPPAANRRRPSSSLPPQRRVLSESGISSTPPEMRGRQQPSSGMPPPTASAPPRRPSSRPPPAMGASARAEPTASQGPLSAPAKPESARAPASGVSQPALPYDPRELEEECDLPLERRKQVLDLFYRLNELDYYEALGLAYDADKKQVRAAYFPLSKAFHPDSMFRKNLGSFKPKMEAVFRFLTEGYETLNKKKSRDEYDAYLRATKAAKMAERALAMAAAAKRSVEEPREEPEASAVLQVPPPPPLPGAGDARQAASSPPPSVASPQARRLAQEVIARRLRGASGAAPRKPGEMGNVSVSRPPAPEPAAPAAEKGDPQELLRSLTRTLKEVGGVTGSNDHVGRAVKSSQAAYARGDVNEAVHHMRKAVALAPERTDLKLEHDRLAKEAAQKLANHYVAQAEFETKQGKWAAAAISWAKVCEGQPEHALAHRQAALSLYKVGGDLRGAQKYAQQAAFLAPNDIDTRILLAQIYLTIGLKLNARRELDAAVKLDPGNEMVKNLLADLKG